MSNNKNTTPSSASRCVVGPLRDQTERVRADDQAGREIADDRAEPEAAHRGDREDADEQQQDHRRERVHLFHQPSSSTPSRL